MSKAFTKEDEDLPVVPVRRRGIPVPTPNLVTAAGLDQLRAELATTGDPDRQRELADHLATAEVAPPIERGDVVGFGARVTVETDDGERTTYHLVGAIEADVSRGAINWQSPLAVALHGARVDDTVVLPRGKAVRVVAIA